MPLQIKSDQVNRKKAERDMLARHLKMDRIRCSQSIREMVQYCRQRQAEDPLIYPLRENPFKEKRTCNIL